MIVRRLHDDAEVRRLLPAWRELFRRAARPEVVLSPTWSLAWLDEFGRDEGRALRVLAVEDGSRLVGLALFTRRRAMHRRVVPVVRLELWLTGEPREHEVWSEYVGVLAEAGREDEVARTVARALGDGRLDHFDELSMTRVSSDDPLLAPLEAALRTEGFEVTRTETTDCPYAKLPGSWDAYLKTLKKGHRYAVRLSLTELEKWAGGRPIALHAASDPRSTREGFIVFRALHGERWAHQRIDGLFSSRRFARFHEAVVPKLLEEGLLDLLWLTVGDEPVAALYNLVVDGRSQVYQSGRVVDGVPRRLSLGTAMHAHAIQRAIARGDREYDFLGGPTLYKRQLSTDARQLVDLVARSPRLRSQATAAAVSLADRLVDRLRPWLRKGAPPPAQPPRSGEPDAGAEEEAPPSSMIPPSSKIPPSSLRPPPSIVPPPLDDEPPLSIPPPPSVPRKI